MTLDDYEDLGPGLHRVGPEPWAFVYNPAKGQLLSIQLSDGSLYTDVITEFTKNKETGEITMTLGESDG